MNDSQAGSKSTARSWRQVSLLHLLIATLAIAAWTAHFSNRYQIARITPKYDRLRNMARELVIEDPSKIAVVALNYNLDVQECWRVYIPCGGFELRLATHGIGVNGPADDYSSVPLPTGEYEIGVTEIEDGQNFRIVALRDGSTFLETQPLSWRNPGSSSSTGHAGTSQQHDGSQPVELLRKRYMVQDPAMPNTWRPPLGPAYGVQLWIQESKTE
ncbi:MAG: hypothetical protein ABL921_07145 [Pirellula sp.]